MSNIKYLNIWQKLNSIKSSASDQEKARNKLIEIYYPLVKKTAFKLAKKINWKLSPEELTSFGVDGLYIAINKFNTKRNVQFTTFASRRIYGSMIDNIRKQDIISRSVRINYNKIEKLKTERESEKCQKVFDDELFKEMGLEKENYYKSVKKYFPLVFSSLDTIGNIQDDFKHDCNIYIKDKKTLSPSALIVKKEFFNKLLSKNFSAIERKIIYFYYYKNYTMNIIADDLNISESRVSQMHKDILLRLKKKILRNPTYFLEVLENFEKNTIEN